jgi:hypothetical protein
MTIDNFYALHNGKAPIVDVYDENDPVKTTYRDVNIHSIHLGKLNVPSGKLAASDPYAGIDYPLVFDIPAGSYDVYGTVADVSPEQNKSHYRECYLTVKISDKESVKNIYATPLDAEPITEPGYYYGIPVDAGMVAFHDAVGTEHLLESEEDVETYELFEEVLVEQDDITYGIFNFSDSDGSLVFSHSGWGDGHYPVIATLDGDGNLTGYHIDLQVVGKI